MCLLWSCSIAVAFGLRQRIINTRLSVESGIRYHGVMAKSLWGFVFFDCELVAKTGSDIRTLTD